MTDKKRGRRPTTPAGKVGPEFVGKTPEADAKKEIALRRHQDSLVARYNRGLPFSMEASKARYRNAQAGFVENVLTMGRELELMRAFTSHGEWLPLLNELGTGNRDAQRMMAAAARIDSDKISAPARKLLESTGAPSKLFDLMALGDEELEKIAGHDTEINPDDVEQMTRSELRRKLRQARADLEARDKVDQRKEQRIEQLQGQVARIAREKPDEKADAMLTETSIAAREAATALAVVAKCIETLAKYQVGRGVDTTKTRTDLDHQMLPLLHELGQLLEIMQAVGVDKFLDAFAVALSSRKPERK